MEQISKSSSLNPIVQDTKNGKLRFVSNVFPFKGYIANYGAFPQTWEDPGHPHPDTGFNGDNDPLDVLDIGFKVAYTGQVKQVKVLGCLAMVDDGETDWKIIAVDVNDPLASKLNDIEDVEKLMPSLLDGIRTWFKNYKVPDGKPINKFAFEGRYRNRDYAFKIIEECHKSWENLIANADLAKKNGISLVRATQGSRVDIKGKVVSETASLTEQEQKVSYLAKL